MVVRYNRIQKIRHTLRPDKIAYNFWQKFVSLKMKFLFLAIIFGVVAADIIPEELLRKFSKIQPRLLGAMSAEVKQIPYQVGISIKPGSEISWCGGSVISDTWVLTAAQCVVG